MSLRNSSSSSVAGRILLVDDNHNGLAARAMVLQEQGHKVSTASCGADALDQFSKQKFDLVVTDYRMPRMDGLELIEQLRKLAPDMPIVLLSGFVDTLGISEETSGADAVLQKSANEVAHLTRAVSRLLRKRPTKKSVVAETRASKAKGKAV